MPSSPFPSRRVLSLPSESPGLSAASGRVTTAALPGGDAAGASGHRGRRDPHPSGMGQGALRRLWEQVLPRGSINPSDGNHVPSCWQEQRATRVLLRGHKLYLRGDAEILADTAARELITGRASPAALCVRPALALHPRKPWRHAAWWVCPSSIPSCRFSVEHPRYVDEGIQMQQRGGERRGVHAAQVHQEKRGKRLGRSITSWGGGTGACGALGQDTYLGSP